jgi:hypothetical protein
MINLRDNGDIGSKRNSQGPTYWTATMTILVKSLIGGAYSPSSYGRVSRETDLFFWAPKVQLRQHLERFAPELSRL